MASGDTLNIFYAKDNNYAGSNSAIYQTLHLGNLVDSSSATDSGLYYLSGLLFDSSLQSASSFIGILPSYYAGGGIQVRFVWTPYHANSGNVIWNLSFDKISSGVSLPSSIASGLSLTSTTASLKKKIIYSSINFTPSQTGSLVSKDVFRFSMIRDGISVLDTAIGYAVLVSIELREI